MLLKDVGGKTKNLTSNNNLQLEKLIKNQHLTVMMHGGVFGKSCGICGWTFPIFLLVSILYANALMQMGRSTKTDFRVSAALRHISNAVFTKALLRGKKTVYATY